ncbi:MAG: hypothetical protein QE263_01860 [Vampirovibrionales bacterium]|nr:hypothetical protein [Vampirovibrionales bacterium]
MTIDPGLYRVAAVPVMAGLFTILPIKLGKTGLIRLAQWLWLAGGVSLLLAGVNRLSGSMGEISQPVLLGSLVVAVIIGAAKGRFVLGKTAKRNLDRLNAITEPQKLVHVYNTRSWIMIGLMLVISASLTWFAAPMLWRGVVNVAVGLALMVSSRVYSQPQGDAVAAESITAV